MNILDEWTEPWDEKSPEEALEHIAIGRHEEPRRTVNIFPAGIDIFFARTDQGVLYAGEGRYTDEVGDYEKFTGLEFNGYRISNLSGDGIDRNTFNLTYGDKTVRYLAKREVRMREEGKFARIFALVDDE